MTDAVALKGEAREVALAEAQTVQSMARDESMRVRLAELVGPGGEQAALTTLRKLPRGRLRSDSAREVTEALQSFAGTRLDSVKIAAVAPGAFTLSIEAEGLETTVRLDATGARVT